MGLFGKSRVDESMGLAVRRCQDICWSAALFMLIALATLGLGHASAFSADAGLVRPNLTKAFNVYTSGGSARVDHSDWDRLLKAYVKPSAHGVNLVDYKAFKSSGRAALQAYIARLEVTSVGDLDRPEQLAFWVNLYNAKTVDIILAHYPVASIREISLDDSLLGYLKKSVGAGGPWKVPVVRVNHQRLSLDNIEHNILRPIFKDPRVHYAINCASMGCPNLQAYAFSGDAINAQLDTAARAFINDPRGFAVHEGRIAASSIYSWFQEDFGGSEAGVLAHARQFANPALKAKLRGRTKIEAFAYDWRLNDVAR